VCTASDATDDDHDVDGGAETRALVGF